MVLLINVQVVYSFGLRNLIDWYKLITKFGSVTQTSSYKHDIGIGTVIKYASTNSNNNAVWKKFTR